jgi:type IV pilus assembly protein PilM
MSFFSNNSRPIGLDISDLSIKLIQLKKSGDKLNIQALGKIDLAPGLISGGRITNSGELAKKIKKLVNHPDFGKVIGNEATICLPEAKTFLKIIEIDKFIETTDADDAVRSELEKHIPLPINDLYLDWQVIGDSEHSRLILVGAAPRKIVNEYLAMLSEAELFAAAVETEPISVCRCLLKEESPKFQSGSIKKNYVIIDIGATDSSLTFYSKNTILFSLSLPISGEGITNQIAAKLDIDHERAEKVKILYGSVKNNEETAAGKIISDNVNELAKRCQESISFFNHHFSAWGPIEQVLICGGGGNIYGLEKIIEDQTGIPSAKGDIFTNFKPGNKLAEIFQYKIGLNTDFLKEEAPKESKTIKFSNNASLCYATAVGLALRGIFINE